ncbi:hypothetical protein B0H14DRAFT_2768012, partial [Mycena olivaceomarginata]
GAVYHCFHLWLWVSTVVLWSTRCHPYAVTSSHHVAFISSLVSTTRCTSMPRVRCSSSRTSSTRCAYVDSGAKHSSTGCVVGHHPAKSPHRTWMAVR